MTDRCATPADVPLLAELNHRLIREEKHRNTMTLGELASRLDGWLATGEYAARIFEDDGKVVAYALYREQPTDLYLRQFLVVTDQRKQQGAQAMQRLLSSIWPKNKRLTVEVLADNATALGFYRGLGYVDYTVTLEILPPLVEGS